MTSKTGSFPGGLRSGKQPVFFLANSLYKKSATIVILQLTFVISRSPREGRRLHLGVFSRFLPHSTSCSPREGCRLHLRSGWNGTYGASVAVPMRGADCILPLRRTVHSLSRCSPREGYGLHPSGTEHQEGQGVAVPVRGADCISLHGRTERSLIGGCNPREGRRLHQTAEKKSKLQLQVAVPARGADCIQ